MSDIIKIGKYNWDNEIPDDILSGQYGIYEYNPLYWEWSSNLLGHVRSICKDKSDFNKMLLQSETHWGYKKL